MDLHQKHTKWLSEKSLKLSKLSTNQIFQFKLNLTHDWPRELLLELDEKEKKEQLSESENLIIHLSIVKKWQKDLDEVLIIDGHIRAKFEPPCIRCLSPAKDALDFSFHACIVDHRLEDDPDFEELTTYYIEGKERELFFYQNSTIDLYEIIHELIYLNKDGFPLHDENCLGLCSQCGENLNEKTCSHQIIN